MQQSPYEIKEKLLQALDQEYNVVDMEAVFEVISTLEKATITKEALEKTRIGRCINELRKRTNNENLARRAKELVKSWRKLLPQGTQRVNGEETHNLIISSPGNMTVVGPGPGPGIGPGPGPGNRSYKTCVLVPQRNKISSPSVMIERSSSPFFSSASNSPLLNSLHQGSNFSPMPSNYAPVKLVSSNVTSLEDTVVKTLFNSNQSKNVTSSHVFKPVSPGIETSSGICLLPFQSSRSNSPGPKSNSCSSSPSVSTNACSSPIQLTHSTLNLAKTNSANKKLQKEPSLTNCVILTDESKINMGNGMGSFSNNEHSGLDVVICDSNSVESELTQFVTSSKTPKRKRSFDKEELQESRLGEMLASLHSGSKFPKVKTTQQIIADLQAKKGLNTIISTDSLQSSDAEVSRTKSELLKKFLISSQTSRSESNRESPVVEPSDYGSNSVPDVPSVISTNFDISSSISYPDPVDEEIKRILSNLPPINQTEIKIEHHFSPHRRSTSAMEEDLNRLQEHWEYVNGVFDLNGVWKPWQDCTEQKSYLGESFQILPYVNID